MEFDGDTLTIDSDMSMEEIVEFEEFIRSRVEYVETIAVDENGALKSSALLALLATLKRAYPALSIPFLEKGVTQSSSYGKIHWTYND